MYAFECRYETSVLQHQPKKDWNIAARHYRLAMAVLPSGEQPHRFLQSIVLPALRLSAPCDLLILQHGTVIP